MFYCISTCCGEFIVCEYERKVTSKNQLFWVLPRDIKTMTIHLFLSLSSKPFPFVASFIALIFSIFFSSFSMNSQFAVALNQLKMLDCTVNGFVCVFPCYFFFLLSLMLFLNIQRSSSIKKTKDVINGFINITSQKNLVATTLEWKEQHSLTHSQCIRNEDEYLIGRWSLNANYIRFSPSLTFNFSRSTFIRSRYLPKSQAIWQKKCTLISGVNGMHQKLSRRKNEHMSLPPTASIISTNFCISYLVRGF